MSLRRSASTMSDYQASSTSPPPPPAQQKQIQLLPPLATSSTKGHVLPPFTVKDRAQGGMPQPASIQAHAGSKPTEGQPPAIIPSSGVCVRVHVVTFNMAGITPNQHLPDTLFNWGEKPEMDMFVFGTQESCMLSEWERLLEEHMGAKYIKVAQDNLMAISLFVYARKQLAPQVCNVQASKVACGVGNVLGNKGGVAVSCTIAGTRIMLVTCHLAAHGDHVERRNADYARIVAGLFRAVSTTTEATESASEEVANASEHISPRYHQWTGAQLQGNGPIKSQPSTQHQPHDQDLHHGRFSRMQDLIQGLHHQQPHHYNQQHQQQEPQQHHQSQIHSQSQQQQQQQQLPNFINPQHHIHAGVDQHALPPSLIASHPLPQSDLLTEEQPVSSLDQMPRPGGMGSNGLLHNPDLHAWLPKELRVNLGEGTEAAGLPKGHRVSLGEGLEAGVADQRQVGKTLFQQQGCGYAGQQQQQDGLPSQAHSQLQQDQQGHLDSKEHLATRSSTMSRSRGSRGKLYSSSKMSCFGSLSNKCNRSIVPSNGDDGYRPAAMSSGTAQQSSTPGHSSSLPPNQTISSAPAIGAPQQTPPFPSTPKKVNTFAPIPAHQTPSSPPAAPAALSPSQLSPFPTPAHTQPVRTSPLLPPLKAPHPSPALHPQPMQQQPAQVQQDPQQQVQVQPQQHQQVQQPLQQPPVHPQQQALQPPMQQAQQQPAQQQHQLQHHQAPLPFVSQPPELQQQQQQQQTQKPQPPPRSFSPTRHATSTTLNKGSTMQLIQNGAKDASHAHDVVLWCGDLNYRINGSAGAVHHSLKAGLIEVLHANDQLRIQMRKGRVFKGYDEQAIHFWPTFKLMPNSQEYHLQRVPSWTDRILHKVVKHPHSKRRHLCSLKPLYYRSVPDLCCSDHRPVVAGYEIHITYKVGADGSNHAPIQQGGSMCSIS